MFVVCRCLLCFVCYFWVSLLFVGVCFCLLLIVVVWVCWMFAVCCLFDVCCMWFIVRCLVFVVRCWFFFWFGCKLLVVVVCRFGVVCGMFDC